VVNPMALLQAEGAQGNEIDPENGLDDSIEYGLSDDDKKQSGPAKKGAKSAKKGSKSAKKGGKKTGKGGKPVKKGSKSAKSAKKGG